MRVEHLNVAETHNSLTPPSPVCSASQKLKKQHQLICRAILSFTVFELHLLCTSYASIFLDAHILPLYCLYSKTKGRYY